MPRRVGTERDERHIVERVFLGMRIHNADDGINARAAVRRRIAVPQPLPEDILIGRNGDTFPRRQSSVKFKTAALTFRPNELLGGIDIAARTERFEMKSSDRHFIGGGRIFPREQGKANGGVVLRSARKPEGADHPAQLQQGSGNSAFYKMCPAQYARIRLENERYPRLLKSGELFFVHRIAGRVIAVPRKSDITLLFGLIQKGAGDIVSAIE